MNEFDAINRFFMRKPQSPGLSVGNGDDCAVLSLKADEQLVVSVDTVIEGVHFPLGCAPDDIASRALCTALSDLAAMGARPIGFTLALTIPSIDESWLAAFSANLFRVSALHHCELLGGDTTRGPLTLSVQVMGAVKAGKALLRSTAKVGDAIFVTGTLGDGAAALSLINDESNFSENAEAYLLQRFYSPTPRLQEGMSLVDIASSAIDISDGLVADLKHVILASGVGAELDAASLPISPLWRDEVDSALCQRWALVGGDDYELCFTVAPDNITALKTLMDNGVLRATQIGKIKKGGGIDLKNNTSNIDLTAAGYQHFAAQ